MIAIVDCGIGNVGSVANMFRKIGVPAVVSGNPRVVAGAEKLVLPGVGAFDHGMTRLHASGLIPILERRVRHDATPILGICLGLQLLTRGSEEGSCPGLAWLPASTVRFRFGEEEQSHLRVPHMGWNTVYATRADGWPSLAGQPRFYFVHSYHLECDFPDDVLATARYGYEFAVAVRRENLAGVQFHPEKSHRFGMAVLRDFTSGV
jgi:glutamine amidotransferase